MNKTLIGLSVALLIGSLTLWFLRKQSEPAEETAYPDRQFAIENVEDIRRIFIADMSGRTLNISLQSNGEWLLNDSLKASPTIMESVLRALKKLSIDHIPPEATRQTVLNQMRSNSLKVEAYDEKGQKMRSILIGPPNYKGTANYAMVEGSDKPYAVRVEFSNALLQPLFSINDLNLWRSLEYININIDTIKSVELRYPTEPSESFGIYRRGDSLAIEPINPLAKIEGPGPEQRILENYLSGFSSIPAAKYIDNPRLKDSITAILPMVQIVLAYPSGKDTLELQPALGLNDSGVPDKSLGFTNFFLNRSNGDFLMIQDKQVGSILQLYSSFYKR